MSIVAKYSDILTFLGLSKEIILSEKVLDWIGALCQWLKKKEKEMVKNLVLNDNYKIEKHTHEIKSHWCFKK